MEESCRWKESARQIRTTAMTAATTELRMVGAAMKGAFLLVGRGQGLLAFITCWSVH